MKALPRLTVIIGSTRPGRVGAAIGQWFAARARKHGGFDVEVADLAEVNLPMLDEPNHPRLRQYVHQHTRDWSALIDRADAVVFVTPEYNHGYPATVKNAIDFLYHEYTATRDHRLRDPLLAHYDPLAVRLARVFPSRSEDAADLVQVARIGLILALDRFDPSRERPFSAFARATITGELKRHLRDHTWPMHVPRSLKEHYLIVCRVADDLTQELQRSPHANEIAARAGLSESEVREVMRLVRSTDFIRLDATAVGDSAATEDPAFGRFENEWTVAALMTTLPPTERKTLRLRFELNLSQADIAARRGVSQMAICRGLQKSLGRLRSRLSVEVAEVTS